MFEPTETARVFALPPGVDFPKTLIDGITSRVAGAPPDTLARLHLIVNTRRMARRVRTLFDQGPARLLPRISLVTDIGEHWALADIPPAVPKLRRRLELAQLVGKLLDQQPDLAPRASLYDLADSLADLIDEMQGEGVPAGVLRDLDVSDMSGHWARALQFLTIADRFAGAEGALDQQARQRLVVQRLIENWERHPPDHPVIVAGSTGSRGTTQMLMKAVARLPQGAVVLPGFDFDQPSVVWDNLRDALTSEDHPQFRFCSLMRKLDLSPDQIRCWTDCAAPSPERNRLVSLALRPAPVTDAWLREGPALAGLDRATADVTLVEAKSPRDEALAIALRLRKAAEDGQSAALITPDRMLTRQVSAALERWGIVPDDSAGLPLHLSPPGRFLRHAAGLFGHRLTAEMLLALLKHPLCHSGADRGEHLRMTRDLELRLRRYGPPFPDRASMTVFAALGDPETGSNWANWVSDTFCEASTGGKCPLGDWVRRLRDLAESAAAGSTTDGSGELWQKNAGQNAFDVIAALETEAVHGGEMTAQEFGDLLGGLLSAEEVRDRDAPHTQIMIWGTLEARVQGADVLVLGSLNEGTWPEPARPDPWLNRQLRHQAGLLLPERRIGLSAHDFQQAIAAPDVWLTRSVRTDDADSIASRWLSRLTNLLDGLPQQEGPALLSQMRRRGQTWLDWAGQLDAAPRQAPAPRPSPRPPVSARPRRLSVTEIKRLIRDPYAIYAKHVLRLRPLDPLVAAPDALARGIVIHDIMERFVRHTLDNPDALTPAHFRRHVAEILSEKVPWPTARRLWQARMDRVCDTFLDHERQRRKNARPVSFEADAHRVIESLGFELVGRADRIDRDAAGNLQIYDYKTGTPPTKPEQAKFDKQLLLEAAIAENGGFAGIDPAPVSRAVFIGLGTNYKEVAAPLDDEPPEKVWADLGLLIAAYLQESQGFTSRRMLHRDTEVGDYDHLARYGEWDRASEPQPEDLS